MLRTNIKFLDPLTQASIVGGIGGISLLIFIFFAIKTGNKNYWLLLIVLSIIIAYIGYKATKKPGLVLENDFDGNVRYLPENGCEPEKLENSNLPITADGVNTGKYPGKVFKLRSGTNVYIDKTGEVRSYSPVSAWVNKWVTRDDFTPKELKCWEKLFS